MAFGQRIVVVASLVVFVWLIVAIFVYRSSFQYTNGNSSFLNPKSPEQEVENCKSRGKKLSSGFWKRVNLHKMRVPPSVKNLSSKIVVQSDSAIVQGKKVHYIHAKPESHNSEISVLLLHGQSYTSETWSELGTIQLLAALGFYPIAVDLPGFGKTPNIPDLNKVYFMDDLISALNLVKPVLISPSMSGSFSLRYLIEHPDNLRGFVPVSPVRTSVLENSVCKDEEGDSSDMFLSADCMRIIHYLKSDKLKLNCIKVPSLIVWGERDKGENSAKLCLLPEGQGVEIPEGRHSAYKSNPDLWHKLLYNFLNTLNETRSCS